MTIKNQTIDRLCQLAQLALAPEERDALIGDLGRIIDMVDTMSAVDTANVDPLAHPLDVNQRLRDDVVSEAPERDRFQACAPAVEAGLYLVPRVVE